MKFLNRYFGLFSPLIIIFLLLVIGTMGYHFIDSYSFFDGFYMTIITIATVGYGEIHPLSTAGRIFTSFLIITSFGTFAYAISMFTKFVIDGEIQLYFKERKLNKLLSELKDHVIICGYGRNGFQATQVLQRHNQKFVVIDKLNEEAFESKPKHLLLYGDATSDELLIRAGIKQAKAIIITLPNDADNLFICLSALNLNPKLTIVSRASEDSSDAKLQIGRAHV